MEEVEIIYNNDVAVIDYLADLKDRGPLNALQGCIKASHQESLCLLINPPSHDRVMLVLYKAPMGMNEGANNLILYIHNDIDSLLRYFAGEVVDASESDKDLRGALADIIEVILPVWLKTQDKEVQDMFRLRRKNG